MQNYLWLLILILMPCCASAPATENISKIKFEGEAQGTYYAVTYYATDTVVSRAAIDSLLDAFNGCASIYDPGSIISRFNQNDTTAKADSLFIKIFNDAMAVSSRTHGAFDITVCQLVNAWGFGFKNRENVTSKLIDSLKTFTGYERIRLENGRLIKEDPRTMIDFNAIAQGFSVDVLSAFLDQKGVENYLVDIGGEVRAKGKKPEGQLWRVGIEKPAKDMYSPQELNAKVDLENKSLATSGNYRKYYEKDGVRYSHTIDPITGYPVQHSMLSASVIASDCITADAYATSFMVMGLEKSQAWMKENSELGLEVYFIYSDPKGNLKTWHSAGFEKYLVKE